MSSDRLKIFISYTQADRRWAEWIGWHLEDDGHQAVLQAWDFRPGSNFVLEIDRATSECDRTLAVLSARYLEKLYTKAEWAAALARDPKGEELTLVPVRVE
ncbi:MAG: toll/interleukin-1 receptor domain-containing protein, partial [Thermoanaerobaculia bacterium]